MTRAGILSNAGFLTMEEQAMAYDRDDYRSHRGGRDRQFSRGDYGRGERGFGGDSFGRERGFGGDSYGRERGGHDEDRGWFERAGDQIASWFGDDDDDRRGGERGFTRDEYRRGRSEPWGGGQSQRDRGYQPMAGDCGRSTSMQGQGRGQGGFGGGFEQRQRPQQSWSTSSQQQGIHDPHYHSLRQRHIDELDRDYDEYRRENQSRFESEFGSWRERRMSKRTMLGSVREHMEVVGNDDQPVGTVDRVAGDRIILTKSDPEAGGTHHSISCGNIERIEDNRVILDCSADQAKQSWRDDDRSRSLNEREDQGEVGPHVLNRSFEGTYR
jgi:hypothetical protein